MHLKRLQTFIFSGMNPSCMQFYAFLLYILPHMHECKQMDANNARAS